MVGFHSSLKGTLAQKFDQNGSPGTRVPTLRGPRHTHTHTRGAPRSAQGRGAQEPSGERQHNMRQVKHFKRESRFWAEAGFPFTKAGFPFKMLGLVCFIYLVGFRKESDVASS